MPATLVLERWAANWKMGSDVVPGAARLLWNATKQHAILGQILIMTCGLAAHMEEALITPNVEHEPCWQPWLWLAREYGYRACWSFPVRTFGGPILGTLAWYFKDPREPSLRMMELAATLTHAAAIIISRHREAEERTRVEVALRESDARYRAFVPVTPDIVCKMSADWSEMQSLVGKEFIASTERPRRDWMDAYIPDADRTVVWEAIGAAIHSKQAFELEHQVIRLDGTIGWTYITGRAPLRSEGRDRGVVRHSQRYYGAQAGRGPAQDPQYRTGAVQQGHGGTGTPDDGVEPQEPWAAGVAE